MCAQFIRSSMWRMAAWCFTFSVRARTRELTRPRVLHAFIRRPLNPRERIMMKNEPKCAGSAEQPSEYLKHLQLKFLSVCVRASLCGRQVSPIATGAGPSDPFSSTASWRPRQPRLQVWRASETRSQVRGTGIYTVTMHWPAFPRSPQHHCE